MPRSSSPYRLVPLAGCPHHLPTVAGWLRDEFGGDFDREVPLAEWEERVRRQMRREGLPLNVVALDGEGEGATDTLLGTATLVGDRAPNLPYYVPRLAFLYVAPAHRGRGLGSALTRRIEEEARRQGHARLYLYATDAEPLYARLGWQVVERFPWRDGGFGVAMARDLVLAKV